MRRPDLALISGLIGGTALFAVVLLRPPRNPVEMRLAGVEHLPSTLIYWGARKAMQATLSVSNSDTVSVWVDMPEFAAKAGGRWIVVTQCLGPAPGINGPGTQRMSPGEKRDLSLLVPEGAEACRVRLRYFSDKWKSRFMAAIGPAGRRWVGRSRWFRELVSPASDWSVPQRRLWRSSTVEIMIPPSE